MDTDANVAVFWGTGKPLDDAQAVLRAHGIAFTVDYESDERGYHVAVAHADAEEAVRVLNATQSRRLLKWIFGWPWRRPR